MKRLLAFLLLTLLVGCATTSEKEEGKISVVASFYPLAEFAKEIGGNKIDVFTLVPPGIEPHDWEPSPSDMARITNADVLLYNGAGLEGWIDKILKVVDNKKTLVVEASSTIDLLNEADSGKTDPHVWLDPSLASKQVEAISNALAQANPSGAELYKFNAINYISRLNAIDQEFKTELSSCKKKEFITSHDAFGYLARRYDLNALPIAGLSPEIEPTPKHMAELLDFVKEKEVKIIFVETMVNSKVSDALARDAGATVDILNPFEGLSREEILSGANYFTVMEQNLNKLKNALDCKP